MISLEKKKVLLIEDFPDFRDIVKELLRGMGANDVDEASNANDGLRFCQAKRYDLILCDYDLGRGSNGLQLLERLRHQGLLPRSSSFIVMSSELSKEHVLSVLEAEPDAYLAKPFTPALFRKRLGNILRRQEMTKPILLAIDKSAPDQAIALCRQHIKKNGPYSHWCQKLLAELLYQQGQLEESQAIYQKLLQQRPFDWAYIGIGRIQLAIEAYDKALEVLNKAINESPMSLQAYDCMAEAYLALDETAEAQHILEKAVAMSSVSSPRQRFLAEVCWQNQAYEEAIKAFRKNLKLAKNSIHDSVDNHLDLARCLVDLAAQCSIERAKDLGTEAQQLLQSVVKNNHSRTVAVQSKLVESRAFRVQTQLEDASISLSEARDLLEKLQGDISPMIELELARTFFSNDEEEQGKSVLRDLLKKNPGDTRLSRQVDQLSDEPLSSQGREKVNQINRRGAELYQQQNFLGAIKEFNKAQSLFPKHVGLKLNLVQAMLGELERSGEQEEFETRTRHYLDQLQDVQAGHKDFERLQNLRRRFASQPWQQKSG